MKTVRVKIAVGVSPSGNYNTAGWSGASDKSAIDLAREVDEGEDYAEIVRVSWVYADVPLPEIAEIEAGRVESENARLREALVRIADSTLRTFNVATPSEALVCTRAIARSALEDAK